MKEKGTKGDWYDVPIAELEAFKASTEVALRMLDLVLKEAKANDLEVLNCQGWLNAQKSVDAFNRSLSAITTGLMRTVAGRQKQIGKLVGSDLTLELKPAYEKEVGSKPPKKSAP